MGLMDVLNGMQNGPHGSPEPSEGGGMSPITMAILGLLAFKAVKHFGADHTTAAPSPNSAPGGLAPQSTPGTSGGLGGLFGGALGNLGGLLSGGAAGSVLAGGLGDLVKQFQHAGAGDAADSWVGTGPNKPIAPNVLENALGGEKIEALLRQTGLSKEQLLNGLSRYLPEAVNHLTPNGRLPDEKEIASHL